GGFSFQSSVFNRATQARRQPGSAFKPFVYAAALDSGYSPSTVILDAPLVIDTGAAELWRPMNASDRFYGPSPMRVGIEQSRNVMTVRLAQAMGMDRVADYAERFGVYEDMPAHLSYSLGAGETTLYQMVAAYAMFANGGWRIEPTLVDRVQDRRGETVLRHEARLCRDCDAPFARTQALPRTPWPAPNARRIMNPVTAYQLVSMLEGVVQRGTASRLQRLGFPVGGKTGTTNESKDAWFIGFTPNLVAGCYVGYDVPRPMGRGAFGGTLCAPVFQAFMEVAMQDRPKPDFQPPRGMVLVKIDRETGDRLPDDASGPNVIEEPYRFDDIPPIGAYAGIQVLDGGFSAGFGQGGDLPMTLEASAASDAARTSGSAPQVSGGGPTSAAPAPTAPQAPRPPAGGFSSGGLY
ncbi:MAG: penicillin-binding transpeptidase domain-containing protein, partial [Pseudomonadota bacterium]